MSTGKAIMLAPVVQPLVMTTYTCTMRKEEEPAPEPVAVKKKVNGLSILFMIIAAAIIVLLFFLDKLAASVALLVPFEAIGGLMGILKDIPDIFKDLLTPEMLMIYGALAGLVFAALLFLFSLFTIKSRKLTALKVIFLILAVAGAAAVFIGCNIA